MINVRVAYASASAQMQVEIPVVLSDAATAAVAIRQSGILQQFPEIPYPDITVGIYGRRTALDALLSEGDRVEIYRDLLLTPMQARALRASKNAKK